MIPMILFLASMYAFGSKHPVIGVTLLVTTFIALL